MKGIFFDTNALFYESPNLTKNDFDKLISNDCKPLTSEIVVLEGKEKNYRTIKKKYDELIKVINDDKTSLYFHTKDVIKPDFDDTYKESNERINKFINKVFQGDVIPNFYKENGLSILFDRYHDKLAPFNDAENASDKGWKDTLIWLSFIDFATSSKLEEYVFVSNDSAFTNNVETLTIEFKQKTGKNISFVRSERINDLFEFLGIVKKTSIKKQKDMPEETYKKVKKAIESFAYVQGNDEDGVPYLGYAFTFKRNLNIQQVEDLCNKLENSLNDYYFQSNIDIGPILSEIVGYCEVHGYFSLEELQNFVSIWSDIKKNYPDKKTPFLIALCTLMNRMVKKEFSDDLPF